MIDAEKLLEAFEHAARSLDSQWGDIKAIVASGFAPSKECIENFSQAMESLQECYRTVQGAAKELLPEEFEPNCSVQTYAGLIERQQQANADREKNIEILKRFISVEAASDAFRDALAPYQQSAIALLEQAGPLSETDMRGPALFLSCLEMPELDSPEAEELLDEFAIIYDSTKVNQGITRKKYYLPSETAAEQGPQSVESLQEDEPTEILTTIPAAAPSQADGETEAPPEGDSSKDLSQSVNLVLAIRPVKSKEAKASAFKNDVMKMPYSRWILPLFTHVGALTSSQIQQFVIFMDSVRETDTLGKSIDSTLEKLIDKNMLTAYEIDGTGELTYCLTSYCHDCMQKASIKDDKKLWGGMKYGKMKLFGEQEMDPGLLIHFRVLGAALLLYLDWAKHAQNARAYRRMRESITWHKEYYTLDVIWDGEFLTCAMQTALNAPLSERSALVVLDAAADRSARSREDGEVAPKEAPAFQPEILSPDGAFFCLQNTVLYRWDGDCWVSEMGADDRDGPLLSAQEGSSDDRDHTETADTLEVEDRPETEAEPAALDASDNPPENIAGLGSETHGDALSQGDQQDEGAFSDVDPYDSLTARDLAKELLESNQSPAQHPGYRELVGKLISEDRISTAADEAENSIAQAVVLAKALAQFDPSYRPAFQRLVLALDSRIGEHHYLGKELMVLFEEDPASPPVLKLMAILRALFAPDSAYDYDLRNYARSAFESYEDSFPGLAHIKNLYNLLLDVAEKTAKGFSAQVLSSFAGNDAEQDYLNQIAVEAGKLMDASIGAGLRAMPKMRAECFDKGSDLWTCMEIIRDKHLESRDRVNAFYGRFLDSKGRTLSVNKIDDYGKVKWDSAREKSDAPDWSDLVQREKITNAIQSRLELMGRWLELTDESDEASAWLLSKRDKILEESTLALSKLDDCRPYDRAILREGMLGIQQRLNGQIRGGEEDFSDLLRTGIFCLDERGVPCLGEDLPGCQYYEPWRNALRHIAAEPEELPTVLSRISNRADHVMYDNLGQAMDICHYLNRRREDKLSVDKYKADLDASQRSAEAEITNFKGELESAFAYGRLSESVKEELWAMIYTAEQTPSAWLELFEKCHNYGCLRAMLAALRKNIEEKTEERKAELRADITERQQSNSDPRLANMLRKALLKLDEPEQNFAVAEEYINRFDAGISEDMDIAAAPSAFLDFVGPAYRRLWELCQRNTSASFRKFGIEYVVQELRHQKVSSQYQNSAERLLGNMPNLPEDATPERISGLLRELGFQAVQAKVVHPSPGATTMVHLKAEIQPDSKDKAEYAHPVDIMGTKLRSPVDVICFFGKLQPSVIVNTVCGMELGRTAIVILNGPLDLRSRRQIAELFHRDKSGQNPFLLIDWVLLLYLAMCQQTDRLATLLSCTLPYTSSFQPFVIKGSVSDEMFIGRKRELRQIIDPNGPVIVYGGRQLGKTALLERAMSLANHPKRKEIAVMVRAGAIENPNEGTLTQAIAKELNAAGLHIPKTSSMSMSNLCDALRQSHQSGEWERLLVLIDEADKLLENFRTLQPAYGPVISLSDLSHNTDNGFKFVFAGLHDVCEAANDPNTIFGQLGAPLIIRPLRAPEALDLLSRPLRYLGFDIDPTQLEHLLVNTNFYPGIVHYVGHCLIENLSTSYAKYYNANNNPPYDLTDKQLGEIMSSDGLNERINERIRWTLDVDPRYFMLARCVAYLYQEYPEKMKSGYSVDNIIEFANLLDIGCIIEMSRHAVLTLLKELVDMGILVQPSEESFRLRQQRFLDIIGSREKIEADIALWNANGGMDHA